MAQFTNTPIGSTPGQPLGLGQVQESAGAGRLQPWQMPTGSYVDVAQQWYTGANNAGMSNGWDTEFFREASRQRGYYLDESIRTGDPNQYLRWLDVNPNSPTYNPQATGVALWSDPTAYGRGDGGGTRVGDVFENGKWVSNLYETYKDDRPTADLLMVDWVLEQDEKARLWKGDDRRERTSEAMDARFAENTRDVAAIRTQQGFQEEVQQRQGDLQDDSAWAVGNVLAPAIASAGLAATSSALPALVGGPVSPLIVGAAAAGGFLFGGITAWWNRDNITELEARAMEITERAKATYPEDGGWLNTVTTGLEHWGPVMQTAINPLTNTVQGINDDIYGNTGDGQEGFYEIDPETGERAAGKVAQGANIAAMLGDSFLQFSSPIGAAMYTGSMALSTFGKAGGVVTKDAGFNLRTGQFEDYETARERWAAWGEVGIDAVQVFTGAGLMSLGRQARALTGVESGTAGLVKGKPVIGGYVYKTDELGEAISRRFSIQMMAPSELVQAVVIGQRTRQLARAGGKSTAGLSADDYYRAAREMAENSRVANAFVTAVAEGTEEAVQAVLEPVSFSEDIIVEDVVTSALMGAASGAGMSFGAAMSGKSQQIKDRRERRDSNLAHGLTEVAENRRISDEEWQGRWSAMTRAEKRRAAILDQKTAAKVNATVKQIEEDMALEVGATSIIGVLAHNNVTATARDDALKDTNPEATGLYQLQARPSHRVVSGSGLQQQAFAENVSLLSAFEVMNLIKGNLDLTARDLADLQTDTKKAADLLAKSQEALVDLQVRINNGEQGLNDQFVEMQNAIDHAKRLQKDIEARRIDIAQDAPMAKIVFDFLAGLYAEYNAINTANAQDRIDKLDEINLAIVMMSRYQWDIPGATTPITIEEREGIRRAVEVIFIRDPRLGLSSYDLNIPQASHELSLTASHRIVQTALQTFKPKNADTDGDTFAALRSVYIRPEARAQLRRGIQFFAATSTHTEVDEKGSAVPMAQVREALGDQASLVLTEAANEAEIVSLVAEALNDPDQARRDAAGNQLGHLQRELRERYVGSTVTAYPPLTGPQWGDAWRQFTAELRAGIPKARENFMNAVVQTNPVGFLQMADESFVREPVHLMSRVFDMYEAIMTEQAANNSADQQVITQTGKVRKIPGRQGLKARSVQRAATAGATIQAIGSSQPERRHQQQHYGIYRSTALAQEEAASGFVPDLNERLIRDYGLLGGVSQSDIEQIMTKYSLEDRVINWLQEMLGISNLNQDDTNAMLMLAQAEVPNVGRDHNGNVVVLKGKTSVLQLLVKRSIEVERRKYEGVPETDPVWAKLNRIERMTKEQGPHSYSAKALPIAIFGGHNNYSLMGEDSVYIGAQMSPDQMLRILMAQNKTNRRRTADRWKRMAGYVKEDKLGDPPYAQNVIEEGRINAYAIIVDSVVAMADVSEKERERTDESGSKKFAEGFKEWKNAVDTWHQQNRARHVQQGLTTREQWVDDLLVHHPEWARPLTQMIPSQAHAATFPDVNGQITAAKWLRKALAMESAQEAEVKVFVYSQYAIFNEKQGTAGLDENGEPRVGGDGLLRYSDLNSEYLRIMYTLGQEDPTRQELYNFIEVSSNASSLLQLRDSINGHPNWLRTDAPWHPYTNDVSAYESNVTDLFGGVTRDSARMEELENFASGAAATRISSTQHGKRLKQEALVLERMSDSIKNGSNVNDSKAHVRNLEKVLEGKLIYPDAIGPTLMQEFFGLVIARWGRGHDKGKPPLQASNLGLPVAFTNAFGLGTDIEQEMAAITANDVDNILSNPTRLVRSVVRLNNGDGSETLIDMRTPEKVIAALSDPVLRPFALSVIENTVRDLNSQGAVVTYADRTREGRPLEEILERTAKFTDVFDENIPKLQRALRGIGLVEAALREEALTLSLDQQDAMNFPITRMISDFLGSYMMSPQGERMSPEELYQKTIIAVWDALLLVADTPASLRTTVQAALESAILDQWGDPMATFDLYANDSVKMLANATWMSRVNARYQQRLTDVQAEKLRVTNAYTAMSAANPNDPRIPALLAEGEFYLQQEQRLAESIEQILRDQRFLPRRLFASWETTLNKYQLTGDPDVDLVRKRSIATWLLNGNQGNRFDGKAAQPLVTALVTGWGDAQMRMDILANDQRFTTAMWNELGAMAAAIEIEMEAGLPASWTSAIPLNVDLTDTKSLNKYFDVSFSSNASTLFDPLVIKAVERMVDNASRARPQEFGWKTTVDQIMRKLYQPELVLGEWNGTLVKQAMWVQQLVSGSSTAITIPIGGDAINRMAETVAAELVTEGQPIAEHYTVFDQDFTLIPNEDARTTLFRAIPVLKLENHFVRDIKLIPTSGTVDPAALRDFHQNALSMVLSQVTGTGTPQDLLNAASGALDGHKLFSTNRVGGMIQQMREQYGMTSFKLVVEFVDVDKKPHTPDHINSPLFDGLGRDGSVGGYSSPTAAMFFGLGAIANITQQKPLDALAKAGSAFRGYLTTTFDTVEQLEQGDVREVIKRKTMHMWQKKYGFGFLLYGDLPAVYKWVKSRHLVAGISPQTGQQELWWSERYITAAETGDPDILQNPVLINLSEKTYKRLIGTVDGSSVNGEVSRGAFKIQDVNRFPLLTNERLRKRGLGSLAKKAGLAQSDVRKQGLLPVLRHRPVRESTFSALNEQSTTWRSQMATTATARDGVSGTWTPERMKAINNENRPLLEQFVKFEYRSSRTNMAMIPDTALRQQTAHEAAVEYARSLQTEAPANSITWVQVAYQKPDPQIAAPDPLKGQFDSKDAASGWQMYGNRGPTYGDQVLFLLNSYLMAAGSDQIQALEMLKRDAAHYAARGVTIITGSESAVPEFRTMVNQWLESEEIGYLPYGRALSVFVPREEPTYKTRVQETQDSTRIATRVFSRRGVTLHAMHPKYGTRQGESTRLVNPEDDPELLMAAHTILPTYLTGVNGSLSSAYSFGLPEGTKEPISETSVLTRLRAALEDPKMYDHLLKALGTDPNMPIFKRHPNNEFDPGILGKEDALRDFKKLVDAGVLPGIGQKVMTGSIVAVVTSDGTIMLQRVGFKTPEHHEIDAQRIAQPKGREGRKPHNIVVSTDKFDANWSVAPYFTITDSHTDINGLHLYGDYDAHYIGKWIEVLGAFKASQSPIPKNAEYITVVPIGNQDPDDKPLKITSEGPSKEETSKQAVREGLINNFRNAFALSGWDARPYLLYFFGHDVDNMTDDEFDIAWNELSDLLNAYARTTNFSAEAVHEAMTKNTYSRYVQETLNEIRDVLKPQGFRALDFADKPEPVADARDYIARRVLAVLAIEGVSLAEVAYTKGLIDVVDDEEVTMLPDELMASFVDTKHPEVFQFLIDEINSRTYKPGVNGKPAYYLNPDWSWDLQYLDKATGKDLLYKVKLRIIMPLPAKENPNLHVQAVLNRGPRASATPHTTLIDAAAVGGRFVTDKDLNRGRQFGGDSIVRFGEKDEIGFYEMLGKVSKDNKNYVRKPKNLPLMQRFADRGVTKLAAYHHRVARDATWTNPMTDELIDRFLGKLNLDKIRDRAEVDYLVRQFWGAPGPIHGQENYTEEITEELYLKALVFMLKNVEDRNFHPLHGGVVPMEHKVFWEKVFKAQIGAAKPWAPVAEEGGKLKKKKAAVTWDQWMASLVAQMRQSDQTYSTTFAIDLGAFWQTYHGAGAQYDITSMSPNMLQNLRMMDPDANEFLLSLDPNMNALLSDPMLLDTVDKTLDALTGMTSDMPDIGTLAPDAISLGDRVEHVTKWQKKQGIKRKQKNQSFRSYMKEGQLYMESDRELNAFAASLIHLQIINRLFLPALWASAYIEVPFRAMLEHTTDVLTGNHAGWGGKSMSGLVEKMGYNPRFTRDDIEAILAVSPTLGASNELMAEVFKEYTNRWNYDSSGPITGKLAKVAGKTALLFADPRRGMRNATIGRLYMNGVIEYLMATNSSVDVRALVSKLAVDPMYLAKEAQRGNQTMMNVHKAGLNRFAQTRGMRRTFTGKVLMAPVDAMLGSSSAWVQTVGAFAFVPFAFTAFTANLFVMLTGQQATDQMLARLFDQRANWLSRLSAVVYGSNYDPEEHDHIDMSDALDGMNLSRAFIQSGISWTTLFTMGSLAASNGLGGEDEEERRRRKMAQRMNLPTYIDPVKADDGGPGFGTGGAEHDFRQVDAIYLDETPLKGWYEMPDGRSAVVPHWIIKQYTAPMMGMARFFETGDMRELAYGFWDAASVIPYSAVTLWRQANESFDIMNGSMNEAEAEGTPDSEARRRTLLTSTVGMMERALVDNQFINSLWTAADKVDRAPWIVPDTDEYGEIIRQQSTGYPMAEEDVLQQQVFTNPQTGEQTEVGATYVKRDQAETEKHMRAERSLTYAVLASLFDGQWNPAKSTYNRFNMVPRNREIALKPPNENFLEMALYTAFQAEGGQKDVTEDEVVRILRHQAEAAGAEWDQNVLESRAQAIVEANTKPGAMSVVAENGTEYLTQPGMDAILTGLAKGSITLDHPAMRGVWATRETLARIEKEWMDRVIEESISYGMTKQEAGYRWRRYWWGDQEDPESPGLKYLFDKIPNEPDAEYTQLNVTYTMGPDGRAWATPFTRQTVAQAFGLPFPSTKANLGKGLTMDARANVVDEVLGINTGLNALMRTPTMVPEDEKEKSEKAAGGKTTSAYGPRKFRRFGGGGGGGFTPSPDFIRMMPLPETRMSPRPDDIPFINTSTPYIRRANIRRERISSERGRLKQWQ